MSPVTQCIESSRRRGARRTSRSLLASVAFGWLAVACAGRTTSHAAYRNDSRPSALGEAPQSESLAPPDLPAWAFARYEMRRGSTQDAFELRTDGSYAWTSTHASGVRTRDETGHARLDAGWVVLDADAVIAGSAPTHPTRGCVVAYGTQRCFVFERQMADFCNFANTGRRIPGGCLLAPELEAASAAPMQATLPPYYAARVLRAPLVARVREVRATTPDGIRTETIEVILDAGAAEGVQSGMRLHALDVSPEKVAWQLRVIDVREHSSRGRVHTLEFVPEIGMKVSTRDPRSPR